MAETPPEPGDDPEREQPQDQLAKGLPAEDTVKQAKTILFPLPNSCPPPNSSGVPLGTGCHNSVASNSRKGSPVRLNGRSNYNCKLSQ